MILHQKMVVPSSRFINCSEAHKFVVEAKGKEVNWVVLSKWTIRDQLRRLERECALPNQQQRPLNVVTLEDDDEENERNSPVQKGADKDSRWSKDRGRLSIGSWMAILTSFELELHNLESELQDCRKAKDQREVELLKVEPQLEDQTQLV